LPDHHGDQRLQGTREPLPAGVSVFTLARIPIGLSTLSPPCKGRAHTRRVGSGGVGRATPRTPKSQPGWCRAWRKEPLQNPVARGPEPASGEAVSRFHPTPQNGPRVALFSPFARSQAKSLEPTSGIFRYNPRRLENRTGQGRPSTQAPIPRSRPGKDLRLGAQGPGTALIPFPFPRISIAPAPWAKVRSDQVRPDQRAPTPISTRVPFLSDRS
jgi:hypothetical protein